MGPYPLQTWHPMLRLPAQLWRRLQGQPLLQMCVWVCVRESPIACSFQSGPVAKQQPCALNRNSFLPFPADDGSESRTPQEETEENNFIEQEEPRNPPKPRARAPKPNLPPATTTNPRSESLERNEVVSTQQMCKRPFKCLFWVRFLLSMGGIRVLVFEGGIVGLRSRRSKKVLSPKAGQNHGILRTHPSHTSYC